MAHFGPLRSHTRGAPSEVKWHTLAHFGTLSREPAALRTPDGRPSPNDGGGRAGAIPAQGERGRGPEAPLSGIAGHAPLPWGGAAPRARPDCSCAGRGAGAWGGGDGLRASEQLTRGRAAAYTGRTAREAGLPEGAGAQGAPLPCTLPREYRASTSKSGPPRGGLASQGRPATTAGQA